ncbi:MAG: Spy/CpxP family protein refolding chaperone [Chloroflexota bacterium]
MTTFVLGAALIFALTFVQPVLGAQAQGSQPTLPEDLTDAWDKFQRALQDWSGQLWERFGGRESRENRPLISLMLNYQDYLRLSPEQVKKLEQLRDNFQRQSIRADADTRILEVDIAELLDQANVDVAKVEAKIRAVEKLRADLRIARIRAVEQAKAVLTPEQRKKFDESIEPRPTRPPRSGQSPPAKEREQVSP